MLMRNARLADAAHPASTTRATSSPSVAESREAARGDLRTAGGPRRHRAFLRRVRRRRTARAAEGARRARPQLLGRREEGGLDHQSRIGRGAGERHRRAGSPAALSRQSPRRGLAGVARVRSGRARRSPSARRRRLKVVKRIVRCAATEVDPDTGIRDLHDPEDADEDLRPRRLRRLCRGDRGRPDRAGRYDQRHLIKKSAADLRPPPIMLSR